MYLIIVDHKNGDVDYYGPFQSEGRALEYANALPNDTHFHIKTLIVPHCSRNVMG
jgi:hypothetical protein